MIKLEHLNVSGWDATIRGMRAPMNSWALSDSYWTHIENPDTMNEAPFQFFLGNNDLALMQKLVKAGSDHRKFLRMINVTCDITAPLYWWKEYDTYKVGTVANSCSTMHKIHDKKFTLDDFSVEHLTPYSLGVFEDGYIETLNAYRERYLDRKNKSDWWQMIQLLPTSYNQKRTVQLNYEVLLNMYHSRKAHKLDEWVDFCKWIEELPYFRDICLVD
jgi:hypothetical protein